MARITSFVLLLVTSPLLAADLSGDAVIRGKAGSGEIVITTTSRLAGVIHSLKWKGQEFLDSHDHGRQLQSASSFDCGEKFAPEVFNPTEAGSSADGSGQRSSSKLLALRAEGNELETTTRMAFWLKPGKKSGGHRARNKTILSDHLLTKHVRIGYRDLPHAIAYDVTFTLPEGEKHTYAQFEAVTGYMPPAFSQFWKYDAATAKLQPLDDGPGEQAAPVVLATPDGSFAMGLYSPEQPSPGYGRFRFSAEKVVKWNCVFRLRDPEGIQPGKYHHRCFVVVGSLEDVRSTLERLHRLDPIDNCVEAQLEEQKIPGLALAIVKKGKLIRATGHGLANLEHRVAVKPETVFQMGSIGKQFTAAAVLLLAEEGKLALDDRIAKHLPGTPEKWKDITIRHLLTHTSGIPEYTTQTIDFRRDYSEAELLKLAATPPLTFAPGQKYSYSNTGYMVLGVLIHQITGKFYGDLLHERIFKPLKMTRTRVISESDIIPDRAAGYRLRQGEWKNQDWVAPSLNTTADGSLYTTVLDLARWDAALYTDAILKKAAREAMWTPVKLNDGKSHPYGLGWALGEADGEKIAEHSGTWQGYHAHVLHYIDRKLTIIVLANLDQADAANIAHDVASLADPKLPKK